MHASINQFLYSPHENNIVHRSTDYRFRIFYEMRGKLIQYKTHTYYII